MPVEQVVTDAIEQEKREVQTASTEISKLARYLQESLGQQVVAYLSGLDNPKTVGKWAAGTVAPRQLAVFRLRTAYLVARMLIEKFDANTAKAWFFGTNSSLNGDAPAQVLRSAEMSDIVEANRSVTQAAKRFVEVAS